MWDSYTVASGRRPRSDGITKGRDGVVRSDADLVLANTPAHVHLYRHAVDRPERAGHDVLVLTRRYACTTDLLDYFDMPYRVYGDHETERYSKLGFARELGGQFLTIATEAIRFGPDVIFGRGPYAAAAGTLLTRTPVVLVLDDEPGDFNHTVSRPFADCILSPAVTRRDLGDAHYTFDGFKECAYLHPDVFEPNADVLEYLGVAPDEPYAIVRFNALDALHDADLGVPPRTATRPDRATERGSDRLCLRRGRRDGPQDLPRGRTILHRR